MGHAAPRPPGERGRVIDVHALDVPLAQKLPALVPGPATGPEPAPTGEARLSDLIGEMDRAGVATSLVVLDAEPEEFLELAARHPGRLFGLAFFDSSRPGEGLERVRALRDRHPVLILGVATAFPRFHQDPRQGEYVPFYEYCLRNELPVQCCTEGDPPGEDESPMALGVLARVYPRLKVVCLPGERSRHAGMPELLWRLPNLFLAVPGSPGGGGPDGGGSPLPRDLLRAAGSRRVMFGGAWAGREADYLPRVEAARSLPWWQRGNVCWRTAVRVYGPRLLRPDPTPNSATHSPSR